jgi:iron complex outermembrane receptor protein
MEMKAVNMLMIVMALSAAAFAQATGSVSGTVMIDGKPVQGAEVTAGVGRVFTNGKDSTTDANGRFEITGLQPGNYTIWARANRRDDRPGRGYYEAERIVEVGSGPLEAVDLVLLETDITSSIRIAETVTIAADFGQPVDEISKTVNVISGQEMRDRADISLADSLRTIPGFRVQQLGGFGRTATIKTRGLRNQDTAVLLDGIRLRDASAITGDASPFLSDLTLTSVSRVEVLRGSGSSLYGTNAIGGTVDLITPDPSPGMHGQISGAIGGLGLGRFRGNLSDGTDDRKFGYNAAISRTAYTKGIDGFDNAHNTNFQGKVNFRPWSTANFSARFFISDAFVRLNVNPDTLLSDPLPPTSAIISARPGVNFVPDENDPDAVQRSKFFNGQIVFTQSFADDVVFQSYYSGLRTSRVNTDGILGPGFQSEYTSKFDGTIHTANAHIDWLRNVNRLTAGYEFEREKFGNDGFTPNPSDAFETRARQSSNTFFVQNLLSLFENKLQLAGGFRGQWFSLERPTFSSPNYPTRFDQTVDPPAAYTGDASVSYLFSRTNTKLRAHVGNGYRVPSLYERFGAFFFLGSFFGAGNPLLKPERSVGIDGGVEQRLMKERLKLTATYFYTEIKDEITHAPTDIVGGEAYFNLDKHFSRGAEVSAEIKVTPSTNVFASYTFTNSDNRNFVRTLVLPPFGPTSIDKRSFGIPAGQLSLVATQHIGRFWVNGDLIVTSSYLAPVFSNQNFSTYTYRFEGNRRLDLTAGYTFSLRNDRYSLRLFGTVENVLDHDYYENGFRTAQRNARIGLNFGF